MKESPIYKMLKENNIAPNKDTIITFSDLSWNDYVDTDRSSGGEIYQLCKEDQLTTVAIYLYQLPCPVVKQSTYQPPQHVWELVILGC